MLLPNTVLNISMVLWLFFAESSICHLSTENVKSAPMECPVIFKSFQEKKKKKTTRMDDKMAHQRMNEISSCINVLSLRSNMLKITF